ncbi:GGDEF domain-containing protein [Vibrio sp. Of7-15]|uniref:GGDEF domain-containing protein n=1 Tax=Vibrio sp. Of7-15 TaxID=2724879 RepID=UPI001EF1A557|nr:GGDEF domain-containing protein [Vibrio sp. Of7-15]MCG7495589.1 GGDEF domain-containing protein [Vibrio sp. Of7-15]
MNRRYTSVEPELHQVIRSYFLIVTIPAVASVTIFAVMAIWAYKHLSHDLEQDFEQLANSVVMFMPDEFHKNVLLEKTDHKELTQIQRNTARYLLLAELKNLFTVIPNNDHFIYGAGSLLGVNHNELYPAKEGITELFRTAVKVGKLQYYDLSDDTVRVVIPTVSNDVDTAYLIVADVPSDTLFMPLKQVLALSLVFGTIFFLSLLLALHKVNAATQKYALSVNRNLRKKTESLRQTNRSLEKLSMTDELTKALTRRGFFERVAQAELHRNKPYGVVMIDVDHFKSFNDRYGHQTGDEVLFKVVQIIISELPSSGFIGRFGGEEFVVYFDPQSWDEVEELSSRLVFSIRTIELDINGQQPKVTVSAGGCFAAPNTEIDEAIRMADECLYQAKDNGRDQSVVDIGTLMPVTC